MGETSDLARKKRPVFKSGVFTDRYIKSLKPESKMYQVREGRGFAIRVLPSGVKTWYYVYQFLGKRRQLNLGNYPDVSLQEAHAAYHCAYGLVKKGKDPQGSDSGDSKQELNLENITVSDLAHQYLLHIANHLVSRSVVQQRRTLERDVVPVIGKFLAKDVRRPDAIYLIEKVADRAAGQARNVLKTARSMFTYALDRELVGHNPFSRITRAVPSISPRARNRILSDGEITIIWEKLIQYPLGRIILLVLVTGQRPGEVAGMKWNEIEENWWIIPEARTKNKRHNRVYLSYLAQSLMPDKIYGEEFVFPVQGRGRGIGALGSTRPGTLSHFITDNDYFGFSRWTPHDLRRTMATGIAKMGCSDEIINEILNHKKKGVISVYNQHRYDDEKRAWLIRWSKFLKNAQKRKASSNVK